MLPVETGVRVDRLTRSDSGFVVRAGTRQIEARQVVVAMSNFQTPKLPAFASQLDPRIRQLHSVEYRNPGQLRDGDVLIVGAGNSGAEIASELAKAGRRVVLSGNVPSVVPFRPQSFLGRHVFAPLTLGVVFHRVLRLDSPLGRKAAAAGRGKATPLIRVKPKDLRSAGVAMVPKVAGVSGREVVLENQQSLVPANVIWCTGFEPGFSWIHLPVFDDRGLPIHRRGVVDAEPGLYFTGLHYLYAMSSAQIHGAARDSAYVGDAIFRLRTAPIARHRETPEMVPSGAKF
jgi:putative flavoprotein involved in K+ transport